MNLINKHIFHDENSYAQSLPSIAINNGSKSYKVEKVLCLTQHIDTLEQSTYNNFHLLITEAIKYVETACNELSNVLTESLEKETYDSLINMDTLTLTIPSAEDIKKRRV